ncbi:ATP-binding protein [Yoonia sp.]|uniref:hybrid sensor histidine kinase/response regulator n=1 Tax=Yoonia sp. TaxID=2212373 RepID=UPI003F6BF6C5
MRHLDDAVGMVLSHDTDHAFLTGADGIVRRANAIADGRFGPSQGIQLSEVLGTIMANPDDVLERLLQGAACTGAVKEDVITRNGHFRLGLSLLDADCQVWRLDELGDIATARGSDGATLPVMTVGRSDTVIHTNNACRLLLGQRPKTLSDVFADLPLVSGQVHTVHAENGRMRAIVAIIAGRAGTRNIFVLPGANVQGAAPPMRAGWDEIEDLPVPLMKIARDGAVLGSNREARQLLRITDTAGIRMGELLDGLGRPINDWLREAAEGRGGQTSQFLRGRGENQDTFVQVTLSVSGDPTDHHLIAVLNDVTELKTLEAQFVQSQKMQAIGQLAGGVAHDFNNLLTAISGHCDLLLLRHDEGDQNYGDLIQIHQNANRAASLVGQLLAFSRKQNLQPEIIDLRDTLSDLTHLLNRLVGEKVTLSLHHDPALAQIKADKRQLEQVLMNLVVNARDAMPEGGEIRVSTENLVLKTQMTKDRAVVPPGEYVVVKVMDFGHGIPPEKLPKIFEPFYTTKRTGEGTGLGLSTAYGIVKQTGGFIFAESEVNRGTQFSLLFPSYDLPVAAPVVCPEAAPRIMTTNADGLVLLVEDEAPVRAFASRALRLHGYTVLEADCAEAALDLLADDDLKVDIFVTDVIMPGMDGPTWVRKALLKRPATQVVFVSGYAEDAFGDGQPPIPNSTFLPKPFSLNALTQTVQQQLQTESAVA